MAMPPLQLLQIVPLAIRATLILARTAGPPCLCTLSLYPSLLEIARLDPLTIALCAAVGAHQYMVPPIPGVCGSDLFPGPGAGVYPTRGEPGVGGSMLVGPNDPRFSVEWVGILVYLEDVRKSLNIPLRL
ncbi:hypothetical protein RND71_038654 [Anisodus tanguticus]|uniref:Uncharacterized protein n=1 Tax=Anisodus tanguticus TaxID=243964 RepID=A0AAE1R0C9_9SOLA|nr:hypothetical protein RND71_038654 [Anisodus tanguticus]